MLPGGTGSSFCSSCRETLERPRLKVCPPPAQGAASNSEGRPYTSGFLGGQSSTGGAFKLKETKVQAGEEVGVKILSSGFFLILPQRGLDTMVAEHCGGPGCFADGTNISMCLPLWRFHPQFRGCETA